MKSIIVRDSEKKLFQQDILFIEKELNRNLPQEYKEFLLTHNGGHPQQDCYTSVDAKIASDIHWFFAHFEGDDGVNLLKEYIRFEEDIPKEFIPIARDGCSNRICLGTSKSQYNKVYFWDFREAAIWGKPDTFVLKPYSNMYLLANSFADFINGLYMFDIKEESDGSKKFVYTYDKYSLIISSEIKRYGHEEVIKNFFSQAPEEVNDYVVEQVEDTKDFLLWYEVKSEGKKYFRKINADGSVKDYEEILNRL